MHAPSGGVYLTAFPIVSKLIDAITNIFYQGARDRGKSRVVSFGAQLKLLFTDKYTVLMDVYFFVYTIGTTLKNLGPVCCRNDVPGACSDGSTQTPVSGIGGIPMGIGIFADRPDRLERKSNIRLDGAAMSIYNRIAVATVGILTGVFNRMLTRAGYLAPFPAGDVSEAAQRLAANGWNAQAAPNHITPAADGLLTAAIAQPRSVTRVISFAFVGWEVFIGAILAATLFFLNAEKKAPAGAGGDQGAARSRAGPKGEYT